jgi:hypothetical protein
VVHIETNISPRENPDAAPIPIHAIDIDHPPGIGIVALMPLALRTVAIQATIVMIAASPITDRLSLGRRFKTGGPG